MTWTLERRARPGDRSKLRTIHTYSEVVRPQLVDGTWRATVHTGRARDHLVRRLGFRLVGADAPQEAPGAAAGPAGAQEPAPSPARPQGVPQAQQLAAVTAWREWSVAGWPDPEPQDLQAALAVQRAPLQVAPEQLAADARLAAQVGRFGKVAVVLVCTGWSSVAAEAVESGLDALADSGIRGAHLVLVQNAPEAAPAMRAWSPPSAHRRRLRRVYATANRGFAAANRLGVEHVRQCTRWLLFTQVDASWSGPALREAIALAVLATSGGLAPVVGATGAILDGGTHRELGRQVGQLQGGPVPVDYVGGSWVLVKATDYHAVGGWDAGFFLYDEDTDLGLRLALAGVRSLVWPALQVDHSRGGTIRPLWPEDQRRLVKAQSRRRFDRRWRSS